METARELMQMDVNKEPLSRAKTHIEEENAGEDCILHSFRWIT